jgi:hypothetical protein
MSELHANPPTQETEPRGDSDNAVPAELGSAAFLGEESEMTGSSAPLSMPVIETLSEIVINGEIVAVMAAPVGELPTKFIEQKAAERAQQASDKQPA